MDAPDDAADQEPQPPLPVEAARGYAQRVEAWSREPRPDGLRAWLGLPYGPLPEHRLDVFAPADARGAPLLVFWHGGGWTNGRRRWVHFMAAPLARRGIVLVAPAYRFVQRARFPAACDDAALALRHVRAQASAWGGDGQRVFLSGHSAGGHLAALTALREPGVGGCLALSGIMDLHHPQPPAGSLEERVYTQVLAARDDDAVFSPIHWTRGNTVPFVLSCGERDSERVLRSNRRMAALLRLQPAGVDLDVWPACDHFDTHLALADPQHPWYGTLQALTRK